MKNFCTHKQQQLASLIIHVLYQTFCNSCVFFFFACIHRSLTETEFVTEIYMYGNEETTGTINLFSFFFPCALFFEFYYYYFTSFFHELSKGYTHSYFICGFTNMNFSFKKHFFIQILCFFFKSIVVYQNY